MMIVSRLRTTPNVMWHLRTFDNGAAQGEMSAALHVQNEAAQVFRTVGPSNREYVISVTLGR